MKIKTFPVNPFEMNCYVYYDEKSKEAVIIDPGAYDFAEKNNITKFIENEKLDIKYILNTHGHLDHILGNAWAKETFNVPLLLHKEDLPLIEKAFEQGEMFGISVVPSPAIDEFADESIKIELNNFTINVLHTPGHSPGGVCYVDEKEKIIFCGDCVFKGSIGRTDLWKGDMPQLLNSIRNKIFKYGDNFTLLPGHYEPTTIGDEKLNNPFL